MEEKFLVNSYNIKDIDYILFKYAT